jgi:hypothetical protein
MKSICFPPTAFEGPQVPRQAGASSEWDLRYDCLLPTAFKGGGVERALRRRSGPGQDVAADRERKNS